MAVVDKALLNTMLRLAFACSRLDAGVERAQTDVWQLPTCEWGISIGKWYV
jgi:hypothetical protein